MAERRGQPHRAASVSRFDFRRPGAFSREAVRGFAAVHELFARRVATGWGGALRAAVQVEEVAIDQATYGDFVSSMPNPNALATVAMPPLSGQIVVELGVELALQLVDRLLGSAAAVVAVPTQPRRLTDVETVLLQQLLGQVVGGLTEALEGIVPVNGELQAVEYNPQLVQVAAPSDRVVLLTYRVTVNQGFRAEGLLTVCYPVGTVTPIVDRLLKQMYAGTHDRNANEATVDPAWRNLLETVEVDASVLLNGTRVHAAELAALEVGDVLRLDHRVDEPATVRVGDEAVLKGHIGRRGRRIALRISEGLPELPVAAPQPQSPAALGAGDAIDAAAFAQPIPTATYQEA